MQLLETSEGREALSELAAGFEQVGRSLRRLADLSKATPSSPRREAGIPHEREVNRLLRRLGPANQAFLWELARSFRPGDIFSLEEAAEALGVNKASVRARMANIGRSRRGLGANAPILWDVVWEDSENSYEWDFDSHRALLKAYGE